MEVGLIFFTLFAFTVKTLAMGGLFAFLFFIFTLISRGNLDVGGAFPFFTLFIFNMNA